MSESTLPNRILVCLSLVRDDAPGAPGLTAGEARMLEHVAWYAEHTGAIVELLHVQDDTSQLPPELALQISTQWTNAASAALHEVVSKLGERQINANATIRVGTPWVEVLTFAPECGAELIIAAANRGGADFIERMIYGSTARRLLRKSPLPVWIVREDAEIGIQRVLVATDLSEVGESLIAIANALAETCGSERTFLHCLDFPADASLRRLPNAKEHLAEYHAAVEAEVAVRVAEMLGDQREGWVERYSRGVPDAAIAEAVIKFNIDLLLIGSVGRAALHGLLIGNTAEKVLDGVTASTWVVKPKGFRSPLEA